MSDDHSSSLPSNGNGQIRGHEERLQHLEQSTSEDSKQIAQIVIKLDLLASSVENNSGKLDGSFEKIASTLDNIADRLVSQDGRLKHLEQKETTRKNRMVSFKKALSALSIAGVGAAASKLIGMFFVGR